MKIEKTVPLSLMVVSLSLIASIGMSVAWYANGAYLRISNVDVSLMSDPQLGISLQNSENIADYHFGDFPADELPKMKSGYSEEYDEGDVSDENGFVPVSSMYSVDWIGKTDSGGILIDPQFCSNYKRGSIFEEDTFRKTKIAKSGYYSVPLYLMCDHDMYVSVDAAGTKFTPNIKANEKKAETLYNKNHEVPYQETLNGLNRIINSLRFSIYDCENFNYWIIDPTKGTTTTYLAGTLDLDANKTFDFYADDNSGVYKEYFFGEYENPENVVYKTVVDNPEPVEYDTFNARHLDGVQAVDMDYYIENNLLKVEDSHTPEELEKMDMISLKNGVPHRIVMSIYIEGWDRDNTSISSLGSFFASLKLKITRQNFSN